MLAKHGKSPGTLKVRGVLTVGQRPRWSRLCTLPGPWYGYNFSLLQRARLLLVLWQLHTLVDKAPGHIFHQYIQSHRDKKPFPTARCCMQNTYGALHFISAGGFTGQRRDLPYLSTRSKESKFGIFAASRGDNNVFRWASLQICMHGVRLPRPKCH